MTSPGALNSPSSAIDEELAALRRAVVALDSKLRQSQAPVHPAGADGAFKLLGIADDLRTFGHQPKQKDPK